MADIVKKLVEEVADKHGNDPNNQVKVGGSEDFAPRISRAEKAKGNAGVKTPWANSHAIAKGAEPYWQTHHANSAGKDGSTTWEHSKNRKTGGDSGPQQHENPWYGLNTDKTDALNQTY